MNSDNIGNQARPETLDADAVCAQCNTVNTEGTLLCKVCGNNLRDQRMIRLAADQAMDLEHTGRRRRTWLSGVLFVLAIVLIVSTLLNQDQIVAWLIDAGDAGRDGAAGFWSGDESVFFDEMVDDLSSSGITEESAMAALESAAATGDMLNANYALFSQDVYVGSARVLQSGQLIYFVALLENGDEVRGKAEAQGNYYASIAGAAALMNRGRIGAVRGVAMPKGGGVAECIGDFNNNRTEFVAYQLPES